jgi:hypothetical protein
MKEKWIEWVSVQSLPSLFGRNRSGLAAMARETGASVTAERLPLEQVLAPVAAPAPSALSSFCAASPCNWACASDGMAADATAERLKRESRSIYSQTVYSSQYSFCSRCGSALSAPVLEPDRSQKSERSTDSCRN